MADEHKELVPILDEEGLTARKVEEGVPMGSALEAFTDSERLPKSEWGEGPWQEEPDEFEFEFEGIPCRMMRNRSGAWSGYVAVPGGHPWYGRPEAEIQGVRVHGGITYSGPTDIFRHSSKWEDAWWIGFDAAHFCDYSPDHEAFMAKILGRPSGMSQMGFVTYKDLAFVRRHVEMLARQSMMVARGEPLLLEDDEL